MVRYQRTCVCLKDRPDEYEAIKKELENGTPAYKICKKFGVSPTTIRKHFGKQKTKKINLSDKQKEEIIYLHNLGVKKGVIEKKFNIYNNLLNEIIKDNNNK